jgi:hypothetical protein
VAAAALLCEDELEELDELCDVAEDVALVGSTDMRFSLGRCAGNRLFDLAKNLGFDRQ